MMKNNKKSFTLLEVVVAIAILGVSLVTLLNIAASTVSRMNRAYDRWKGQHVLTQALEYYLLTGDKGSPPSDIFPYDDYEVVIEEGEPENLPEGVEKELDQWKLIKINAKLLDREGDEVEWVAFDKIICEKGLGDGGAR